MEITDIQRDGKDYIITFADDQGNDVMTIKISQSDADFITSST
jgi:hypothetical protein